MPILTLLTDFGTTDWYAAALAGVVLTGAPHATLVTITHQVAPGDVAGASFLLHAAAPTFPPGTIHLAVVDPGVGSPRRILAARTGGMTYLAPDNGLLTPLLRRSDLALRQIDRPDLYRRSGDASTGTHSTDQAFGNSFGNTFHGRDRFAPVAAALLCGEPFENLGPLLDVVADAVVDLAGLGPLQRPGELLGRVVHIDHFGNLVTDLPSHWLAGAAALSAEVNHQRALRLVSHYAELAHDEPGVIPGSLGTLELSLPGASLAARWQVERGMAVHVRWVGGPKTL